MIRYLLKITIYSLLMGALGLYFGGFSLAYNLAIGTAVCLMGWDVAKLFFPEDKKKR